MVTFSTESSAADSWMREHYSGHQIYFDLFRDLADALALIEAAIGQGLSIGSLDRHGLSCSKRKRQRTKVNVTKVGRIGVSKAHGMARRPYKDHS